MYHQRVRLPSYSGRRTDSFTYRSIVSKAATNTPFLHCLTQSLKPALSRPHQFLVSRPFLLIFSLYFSTYLTANSVDTITSVTHNRPSDSVTASTSKFLATSAVNMTMCVYKDSQFARMFGVKTGGGPAAMIPKMSYALFAARDSITIFASFNLPPLLSQRLKDLPPAVQQRFSRILSTDSARANTAQFIAPAAMQVFSTPIHLLGLDLFNRQQSLGMSERVSRVCRDWTVSAIARMGRIIPAFGVGGVVNGQMRRSMMQRIES